MAATMRSMVRAGEKPPTIEQVIQKAVQAASQRKPWTEQKGMNEEIIRQLSEKIGPTLGC